MLVVHEECTLATSCIYKLIQRFSVTNILTRLTIWITLNVTTKELSWEAENGCNVIEGRTSIVAQQLLCCAVPHVGKRAKASLLICRHEPRFWSRLVSFSGMLREWRVAQANKANSVSEGRFSRHTTWMKHIQEISTSILMPPSTTFHSPS